VLRTIAVIAVWLSLACGAPALAANDEAVARNEAGGVFFREGKFAEAIAEFQKALQQDAGYLPAQLNLAYAYERMNRRDEAIREYRTALTLAPDNFFARNNLGVLYDQMGRYEDAIVELEMALKAEPGNATASSNLARAKKNQAIVQERKTQIEKAERAAQAKPGDPQASYYLARLHASYGNKGPALQWLQKALKLGFKDIDSIKKDVVFDSLREDREFQLVLQGK
jgi:Tfp pilus assembly protein PilF